MIFEKKIYKSFYMQFPIKRHNFTIIFIILLKNSILLKLKNDFSQLFVYMISIVVFLYDYNNFMKFTEIKIFKKQCKILEYLINVNNLFFYLI